VENIKNRYFKNGIHYVGQTVNSKYIHCNPYLLVDNDEAVLFEPGSVLDFEDVLKNVTDIIALKKIKYVFISHPDPDLASSLPLFEKVGLKAKVICDWKTYDIIYFYGIKAETYIVGENKYELVLSSGRKLKFIPAPFAHYSGNIICYDELNKTLFSGDLFGGYSKNWELFAGENYHEAMATFHENYMPSSDFLKPVMKELLKLDITTILPQHGSIIEGEMVLKSIKFLYKLNFYNSTNIVNRVVNNRRDYNFVTIINQVLTRLRNFFPDEEILEVFEDSVIQIDPETLEIAPNHEGKYQLWNQFFNTIYNKKGNHWLSLIETLVKKITRIYNIKKPEIYNSEMANKQTLIYEMELEKEQMLKKIDELEKVSNKQKDKLSRCKITNLRYTSALRKLLKQDLENDFKDNYNGGVIYLKIDNLDEINTKYSSEIGDETLRIFALKVQELLGNKILLFRDAGPTFYAYLPNSNYSETKFTAVNIRNEISQTNSFIEQITVSISIVNFDELKAIDVDDQVDEIFDILNQRMEVAITYGGGHLIDHFSDFKTFKGHILLIDEDDINRNILLRVFKQINYEVITASDVYEALYLLEKIDIDVIISEINLSKMDGFALKRNLNQDDKLSKIPFIMLSHNKNHDTIRKANQLDVDFIVKKPFYPEEIIGIVQRIKKRAKYNV